MLVANTGAHSQVSSTLTVNMYIATDRTRQGQSPSTPPAVTGNPLRGAYHPAIRVVDDEPI